MTTVELNLYKSSEESEESTSSEDDEEEPLSPSAKRKKKGKLPLKTTKLPETSKGSFVGAPSDRSDYPSMETNVDAASLSEMVANKDFEMYQEMGEISGLCRSLRTDIEHGLPDELEDPDNYEMRHAKYGTNVMPDQPHKNFFEMWFDALKDLTLIILMIAAGVSLALVLLMYFLNLDVVNDCPFGEMTPAEGVDLQDTYVPEPQEGFEPFDLVEGLAILLAVFVVSFVGALNDFKKEKKFRSLSKEEQDNEVNIIRGGQHTSKSIFDLVVGDIVSLTTGDQVPADGIYISGTDLRCDESQMTGETDEVKKKSSTPFMLSGCKISAGRGRMLVTSVGANSVWGKTISSLQEQPRPTPLQENLDDMATLIGKVGMAVAGLVFLVQFFWWLVPALSEQKLWRCIDFKCYPEWEDSTNPFDYSGLDYEVGECVLRGYNWANAKILLEYIIVSITIVVVAVPEGLPLAVTISLAYSMTQMYKDQNLVRHLKACETMSNCTNICSDKTGTLTENRMTVVEAWIVGYKWKRPEEEDVNFQRASPFPFSMEEGALDKFPVKELLINNICLNSAETTMYTRKPNQPIYVKGNKTECALLLFSETLFHEDEDFLKRRKSMVSEIYQEFPFDSKDKRMSTITWTNRHTGKVRLYCKGAPEILLSRATHMIDIKGRKHLNQKRVDRILEVQHEYARRGLRTLALAYRDLDAATQNSSSLDLRKRPTTPDLSHSQEIDEHPPIETVEHEDGAIRFASAPDTNLTIYALFGIEDPLRPEVPRSVADCQKAGIYVRMVTGDKTAKAIAIQCHILSEGGKAIEGPEFARLSDAAIDDLLPNLQVLARSSPMDKQRLVNRLICNGEVVAVTGDGTNDVQALKEADVGLAMGIRGTYIAKQAADIVILDDNFESIVKAVMWGRSVYDNIRKFLQFQLTVNLVSLTVVFVGAIAQKGAVMKAIQLMWVNLIMDTLAALALGTEKPVKELLDRKPFGRFDRLLSNTMLRNMGVQGLFQVAILLVLLFAGPSMTFLGVQCAYAPTSDSGIIPSADNRCMLPISSSQFSGVSTDLNDMRMANDDEIHEHTVALETIIFNTFVFMQIFNEINSRKVNNEKNVWDKIWTNYMFVGILVATAVVQVILITATGEVFQVAKQPGLTGVQWALCIALALLVLPLGLLITLIPVPNTTPRKFKEQSNSCFACLKRESEGDTVQLLTSSEAEENIQEII